MPKSVMISFIVPAYNEERVLGATLDALHSAGRAVGEPYWYAERREDSQQNA
jgi:hypothetical protein